MYILVLILFTFVSASYHGCPQHECQNEFKICEKMDIKDCECNGQLYCVHSTVISDYQSPRGIVFIISLFIMMGLSNLVGMGGETSKVNKQNIKVPISMYLMLYNNYEAVIFSYFGTLGSGILNSIYIVFKDDTHIDYEMIQVIFPALIVGSEIGNYINRKIPDYIAVLVSTITQFIVLLFFIYKTFKIIKRDRKKYTQQQDMIEYLNEYNSICGDSTELPQGIEYDQSEMKVHTMKFIILVSVIYQTSIILRGGKYFSPFFEFDGMWFRVTTAIIFAICIIAFIVNYIYLNRKDQKNKEDENPSYTLKRRYQFSNYILIWLWSIIGSFLTGFIGIGNGLLVPIFIISKRMKMSPKAAIATQSITQMLMAISMAIQTFLNPTAKYEDIAFYLIIGLLSVIFVTFPLKIILKKFQYQNSILVGIINLILIIDILFGVLYLAYNSNLLLNIQMPDDCCDVK